MRHVLAGALAGATFLATATGPARAAEAYSFDTSHTHILFFVDHFGFSTIQGEFLEFDGSVMLDTQAPENSSVAVTIRADSLDTGHGPRDEHFRDADFFDVESHPEITFESTSVVPTGFQQARVTGDLTIKGMTRPVVLDVTLNRMGTSPISGDLVAGFTATTTVLRSDFGLGRFAPAVSDAVEIRIETETSPAG